MVFSHRPGAWQNLIEVLNFTKFLWICGSLFYHDLFARTMGIQVRQLNLPRTPGAMSCMAGCKMMQLQYNMQKHPNYEINLNVTEMLLKVSVLILCVDLLQVQLQHASGLYMCGRRLKQAEAPPILPCNMPNTTTRCGLEGSSQINMF